MRPAVTIHAVLLALATLVPLPAARAQQADRDSDPAHARAVQAAVRRAALAASPWTVRVEALAGSRVGSGPLFDDKGRPKGFNPTLDAASTGVIVRSDGLVATSTFSLETNPRILTVILGDGREFPAKVLARDDTRMIAILKIDAADLPTPEIVPVRDIDPGVWALALGRTFSGHGEPPTVNLGVVSAKGRHGGKALQTDASVNPANYGGPLVDIRGRAMGLVVPFSEEGGQAGVGFYDSGIGFAIPLEDVLALVPRLAEGLSTKSGFLGIQADPTHVGPGIKVGNVVEGTPAAKAGLVPGDLILALDGLGLLDLPALQAALAKRFAGDKVVLTVHRGDEDLDLEIELGERPN